MLWTHYSQKVAPESCDWEEAWWPKHSNRACYVLKFEGDPHWYITRNGHIRVCIALGPFVDVEEAKAVYLIAGFPAPEVVTVKSFEEQLNDNVQCDRAEGEAS